MNYLTMLKPKTLLTACVLFALSVNTLAQVTEQEVTYTYTSEGQIDTIDGPRLDTDVIDVTDYNYDPTTKFLSEIIEAKDVFNFSTAFQNHNSRGNPQLIIDPNGVETTQQFHARGWLEKTTVKHPTDTSGTQDAAMEYRYDSVGQTTCTISPTGVITIYHYTPARYLASEIEGADHCDPLINSTGYLKKFTYNNAGDIVSETIYNGLLETDPVVFSASQQFDELGRVMDRFGHNGQHTHFDYDTNDFVTKITEQIDTQTSRETDYFPDNFNKLARMEDALDNPLDNTYDAQGQLENVKDARNNSTHYDYDAFGNVETLTSPDAGVTNNIYDEANNLRFSTDARGIQQERRYDALNRLTDILYASAPNENVQYYYDHYQMDSANPDADEANSYAVGRLTGMDGEYGKSRYYYDHRGNITKVKELLTVGTFETRYAYRLDNSVESIQYPSGRLVNYFYDSVGRVTRMTTKANANAAEQTVIDQAQYKPFGPLTSMVYGNGLNHIREYDLDYLLEERRTFDNTTLEHFQYTFDGVNNLRSITDLLDATHSHNYQYDLVDRLINSQTAAGIYDFIYDEVGNRLSKTFDNGSQLNTETYQYAINSNRIDTLNHSDSVSYDDAGNTLQDGRGLTVSYNHANRQQQTTRGGLVVSHIHNPRGQRVAKLSSAGNEYYQYDLSGTLLGVYDSNLAALQEFIYLNGEIVALVSSLSQANQSTQVHITTLPANDGWIRESGASTLVGGTVKTGQSNNKALRIGDDKKDREYRSVLVFDLGSLPAVTLESLDLQLKRTNSSKVGNPSDAIQVWLLPTGSNIVKADFQHNTSVLAGQLSAGNTGSVNFSQQAIDEINAQRSAGASFIKLRLQATSVSNNKKNDYMGYFTREQSNASRHPVLTIAYSQGGGTTGPEMLFTLNDHLGTTQTITDAQQNILWRAHYSPFGVASLEEDVDGDGNHLRFNLRFPGQYFDSETGQVYNWHRYYDPYTGRYITSDPLGLIDGPNTYAYVINNPVNNIDPTGLANGDIIPEEAVERMGTGDHLVFPEETNNAQYNACMTRCKKKELSSANTLCFLTGGIAARRAGPAGGMAAEQACSELTAHLKCSKKCQEEPECSDEK